MLCNEKKSKNLLFFTLWLFLTKLNCIFFSTIRETCLNTILSSRETICGVSAAVPDPVKIRLYVLVICFYCQDVILYNRYRCQIKALVVADRGFFDA